MRKNIIILIIWRINFFLMCLVWQLKYFIWRTNFCQFQRHRSDQSNTRFKKLQKSSVHFNNTASQLCGAKASNSVRKSFGQCISSFIYSYELLHLLCYGRLSRRIGQYSIFPFNRSFLKWKNYRANKILNVVVRASLIYKQCLMTSKCCCLRKGKQKDCQVNFKILKDRFFECDTCLNGKIDEKEKKMSNGNESN